jgi:hypothetical protein
MNLLNSKSLIKSAVASGLVVSLLALPVNGAFAANLSTAHKPAAVHVQHRAVSARVTARRFAPPAPYGFDIGQFIAGVLGGPLPPQYAQIVRNAMAHRSTGGGGSYDSGYASPSYSEPVTVDNSAGDAAAAAASQAASDASVAAEASAAAAEEENDAANSATVQTEINAGM